MNADVGEKGLETLIVRHLTGADGLTLVTDDHFKETPEELSSRPHTKRARTKPALATRLRGRRPDRKRCVLRVISPCTRAGKTTSRKTVQTLCYLGQHLNI